MFTSSLPVAPTLRRFLVAAAMAAAGAALVAAPGGDARRDAPARQQTPGAQQPAAGQPTAPDDKSGQKPPTSEQDQRPTFRTEANFVRVDVYPTAGDDRPVQDLTQADFEVFEDGQRQEVRTFEHVVIRGGPQETRSEPQTVEESRQMAGDARARLFVLFLDTYHVSRDGAGNVRRALSRLLQRTIAENDMIAVMTPEMSAGSLTFVRRAATIDDILDKTTTWGRRFEEVMNPDPTEEHYESCFPAKPGDTTMSAMAREMIARRREKLTLDAMRDLVHYLQGLREERKAILMVSEGWALYRPNSDLARPVDGQVPGPPPVGVGPTGGLRVGDLGRTMSGGSRYECDQDRIRLAQEDHEREFRDLLDEANRGNASFYSIHPRGLPVWDTPISSSLASVTSVGADQASLHNRQESLRTLSVATDGIAVMNGNDLDKGFKRLVDDLSAYYLLGYYSSNAKADGKYHSISVRVKRPGVAVRARRGYRSPTKEDLEAVLRGASASGGKDDAAAPVTKAVTALSRIRTDAPVHAMAGYEWQQVSAGGPPAAILWVTLELDPAVLAREEPWRAGADVAITVTAADKSPVGTATQLLKRDARNAIVRVPAAATFPGDYSIRVTSKPAGAALGSTETLRVVVPRPPAQGLVLGQTLVYRRGPFTGTAWQPVGDLRFRRQERVKAEIPVLGAPSAAEVQLLDRNGKPLGIPVTSATRDVNGVTIVSGEVTLAPLTTGDYVLETTIHQGVTTQKVVTAFRIIP